MLRRKRPDAERPYKAFGYPIVPAALYHWRDRDSRRALHLSDCDHLARPHHRAERGADLFPVAEISRRSRPIRLDNRIKLTTHGKSIREKASRQADGRSRRKSANTA